MLSILSMLKISMASTPSTTSKPLMPSTLSIPSTLPSSSSAIGHPPPLASAPLTCPRASRTATGRRGHKSIGTWLGRVEVEVGHPTPPARACHQVQFEHPPRAPVPQLLSLLRGRPALPREHSRPAALAACSLPRRTIPHAVPRTSLTSRRAVRPTGRHVQPKFGLSTHRAPRSHSFSLFSATDPRSPTNMPGRPPSPRAPSPGGRSRMPSPALP